MSDKYAKKDDCVEVHEQLNERMLKLTEDVGYIRGQVDTLVKAQENQQKNDSDWWSRMIAIVAVIIAWVKGG